MLTTAHPHLDRASKGMLNYAAALGPRNEYRFFHLAPGASKPRGDRAQAGRRARVHALVRAQRALARAGRVPVRGQPAAAGVQRPPVHRELPLEARARDPLHPPGSVHGRGARARSRPTPASAFTTSIPTRTATRSWSTSASSTTRRSWRTSTSSACGPASRSPGRSCGGSGSRPGDRHGRLRAPQRGRDRAAADQLRPLQRASLSLRLGRRDGRVRVAGGHRQGRSRDAARRPSGRSPGASRASPCSSPSPRGGGGRRGAALDRARLRARELVPVRARRGIARGARPGRGAAPHPVRLSRSVLARLSPLGDSSHARDPANLIERSHSGAAPDYGRGRRGPRGPAKECRARRSTTAHSDTASRSRLPCSRAPSRSRSRTARAPARRPRDSTRSAPSRTRSAPSSRSRTPPSTALLGQVSALRQREDAVAAELAEAGGEARRGEERPRRRARRAGADQAAPDERARRARAACSSRSTATASPTPRRCSSTLRTSTT